MIAFFNLASRRYFWLNSAIASPVRILISIPPGLNVTSGDFPFFIPSPADNCKTIPHSVYQNEQVPFQPKYYPAFRH